MHGVSGVVAESGEAFAEAAVQLASDQAAWKRAQAGGRRLLAQLYAREANLGVVRAAIESARVGLAERRAGDVYGALLWQQSARSTEFFSRWIELKERQKNDT